MQLLIQSFDPIHCRDRHCHSLSFICLDRLLVQHYASAPPTSISIIMRKSDNTNRQRRNGTAKQRSPDSATSESSSSSSESSSSSSSTSSSAALSSSTAATTTTVAVSSDSSLSLLSTVASSEPQSLSSSSSSSSSSSNPNRPWHSLTDNERRVETVKQMTVSVAQQECDPSRMKDRLDHMESEFERINDKISNFRAETKKDMQQMSQQITKFVLTFNISCIRHSIAINHSLILSFIHSFIH
jgi:hypothetical protein